jgi:aryl sulfotransferase
VSHVHYDDLAADLQGEMARLAKRLGIPVSDDQWAQLVRAAAFDQMRSRADQLAPDVLGILKDRGRFFRQGRSGVGRDSLSEDEYAHYLAAATRLSPADMLRWLHREAGPHPDPGVLLLATRPPTTVSVGGNV